MERVIGEIRRCPRVVGAFPDGNSALMLVAATLSKSPHQTCGKQRYLPINALVNPQKHQAVAQARRFDPPTAGQTALWNHSCTSGLEKSRANMKTEPDGAAPNRARHNRCTTDTGTSQVFQSQ